MTMTDNEIRIEIAESLGWQWWQFMDAKGVAFHQIVEPQAKWPKHHNGTKCKRPLAINYHSNDVPNYTEDLNAIHEVENKLPDTLYGSFVLELQCVYLEITKGRACAGAVSATARQRAEAYLRTIGKWRES